MDWIGTALASLIVAIIVIAIAVKLLDWLYVKSSGDVAFVRTGLGGSKVVRNGGALVIPVIHQITGVSLNSLRIEVSRRDRQSLQTADHMRVNVQAAFYVHVDPQPEAIITAAATLGGRIQGGEGLGDLLEARLVDALRAVAAATEMATLHADRAAYVARVGERLRPDLASNGLVLESVSLIDFDQAGKEFFNPQNAFDAEGLTRLSREIEDRRRIRNEIERDTELAIQRKQLDVEQKQLQIEQHQLQVGRETEFARLQQKQDIAVRRAQQAALVAAEEAKRRLEAEQAAIESTRGVEVAQVQAHEAVEQSRLSSELLLAERRVATQQETQLLEIRREQALRVGQFERDAEVQAAEVARDMRQARMVRERASELGETEVHEAAVRERAQKAGIEATRLIDECKLAADAEVGQARALAELKVKSAEIRRATDTERAAVDKSQVLALAEEERAIAVSNKARERIEAQLHTDLVRAKAATAEAAVGAARQMAEAEAQQAVASVQARSAQVQAQGKADAQITLLQAQERQYTVDAQGRKALVEADNGLSLEQVEMKVRLATLERLPQIIAESARPMQEIDNLQVIQVEGLNPGGATGHGGAGGGHGAGEGGHGGGNLAEQLMSSALRYRAQAPLVDSILHEVGLDGSSLQGLVTALRKPVIPLPRPGSATGGRHGQ